MFGFGNASELNDPLGTIECKEGRVVVFPNILQHCVQVLLHFRVAVIFTVHSA